MVLLNYDKIKEEDELPSLTKEPITQLQLIRYAGASGDFNQIHTVPEYAKEAGLKGTIAQGMLVMGILGQMITSWAGVKAIKEFSVSFKAITNIGDILTAKGVIKRKYQDENGKFISCKLHVEDQKGDVKLSGKAVIKFD